MIVYQKRNHQDPVEKKKKNQQKKNFSPKKKKNLCDNRTFEVFKV